MRESPILINLVKTGQAREYGCPIGTVFKIGDADGTGNCEDPEDVPGWWVFRERVYMYITEWLFL